MFRWLLILLFFASACLALHVLFMLYPTRGASAHFLPTTPESSEWLLKHRDEVKMRLLSDHRLISAYALPENQGKQRAFRMSASDWPLYGVKGSEFEGITINLDSIGVRNAQGSQRSEMCISINFLSSDRLSKKVRDLEELISSAIGKDEMQHVRLSVEVESIFPHLGDGA